MLIDQRPLRAGKGTLPTQPFVGDDTKRILVTGKAGMSVELLWSHVGDGAHQCLITDGFWRGSKHGEAKITE